jgi:hypothetical protein
MSVANPYFIAAAPAAETEDLGYGLFGLLRGVGYSREWARDISERVYLLTGYNDTKAILTVDAGVLADALNFSGFQRRRLLWRISEYQEAVNAGQTDQQYINHVRARSHHRARTC